MSEENLPPVKPEVNLQDFEVLQRQRFDELRTQRNWIVHHYADEIRKLEDKRDTELLENIQQMAKIGIPEEELPLPPLSPQEKAAMIDEGYKRKLSHSEIKRVLAEVMRRGKPYASSYLLGQLRISYKDFKDFVDKNPDFIKGDGINKWKTYCIVLS